MGERGSAVAADEFAPILVGDFFGDRDRSAGRKGDHFTDPNNYQADVPKERADWFLCIPPQVFSAGGGVFFGARPRALQKASNA